MFEVTFYPTQNEITFCYNDRCSAQSIIDFMKTQEHLSDEFRQVLCREMLVDYLIWVGSGCCI